MSKRELRQNLYRAMHAASNDLIQYGGVVEQERIIGLWDLEMACDCEEAMQHLKQRIEGDNK